MESIEKKRRDSGSEMVAAKTTRSSIQSLVLLGCIIECAASSYNRQDVPPPQQWAPPPPLHTPPDKVNPGLTSENWPPPPGTEDSELPRWDQTVTTNSQHINPSQSAYTPIDYQFRSKQPELPQKGGPWRHTSKKDPRDDIPLTASDTEPDSMRDTDIDVPKFATARQDAVGRYMSTFQGRLSLRTSSTLVGCALGGFVGKSLFNAPSFSIPTGFLFLILTFARNPYGELARALGLTLIFV